MCQLICYNLLKLLKQMSSQVVEICGGATPEDMRASVLHQQSPIHSYLFGRTGNVLITNLRALRKHHAQGRRVLAMEIHCIPLAKLLLREV